MIPQAAIGIVAILCPLMGGFWPTLSLKPTIAAQIEKETCKSSQDRMCFSPAAELKTSREYGFGLGQLTNTPKTNNFVWIKGQVTALQDWPWDERLSTPVEQIIALLHMDRALYGNCIKLMSSNREAMACAFASYNGGYGGFWSDRNVCENTRGCDPTKWFGNIENTSLKAKTPVSGYGQPFFQINRAYVRFIIDRYPDYTATLESAGCR